MRKFVLLASIAVLGACSTPTPIPPEIKVAVDKIPVDQLPRYASREQQRCGKSRSLSFDKRRECKYKVRRELVARQMMREQNEATEQKNVKEQSNEPTKN
jgi:hypothetical protein